MKSRKAPYIKISSLFLKSMVMLMFILILPTMFIISELFANSNLEFSTNTYSKLINENIQEKDRQLFLTKKAKKILLNKNIWIQIVDNSLKEVYSYNKPYQISTSYTPISFINAYKNAIKGSTVYVFETKMHGLKYSYFLGFQSNIASKYNMTFNPSKVRILMHNIIFILAIDLIMIVGFAYLYFSKKLGKPMEKIINCIIDLSKGNYNIEIEDNSIYKEIFSCLDSLKNILKENKEKKDLFDKSREKWISYISHDMKTPLSSIKGFSELLKDDNYTFSVKERKSYCNIIYEKSLYIEDLINDLNFSYKIKNCTINLNLEKINLVDFLKKIIDELLLNPKFNEKHIYFKSYSKNIIVLVDINLMRRAFSNLIVNFLIYNNKNTKIVLEIVEETNYIRIILEDNGRGMSEEEKANAFQQYFRGTNTACNPNGSGLGMAIANELINLHNGKCFIESEKGVGTTLKIILARN